VPDDHLDAAVEAVARATHNVMVCVPDQSRAIVRAALAPHWPTVTEAMVNKVYQAAFRYYDGFEDDIVDTKQYIRSALLAAIGGKQNA
jgi:broad specificity polyphosphatase/5'/3'-nucleotidase SurE